MLFVGSCSGRFYAGRVFAGADAEPIGHLYAFDAATGRVVWKLPAPGGVPARVLAGGGLVYAQTAAGEGWAVDQGTGELAWLHRTEGRGAAGRRQVDPVLEEDRLVVGWPSGDVEALDAVTGELLWRVRLGQRLNTSLAAIGGQVFVGSVDGKLHALALADGRARPPIELGGLPYGDLVTAGGRVLVLRAGDDYSVSCLDPASGKTFWSRSFADEIATFRPLLVGDAVVIGFTGRLVALVLADGKDAWSCAVGGVPRGLSADGDRLFVGTLSGKVTALPVARCTNGG